MQISRNSSGRTHAQGLACLSSHLSDTRASHMRGGAPRHRIHDGRWTAELVTTPRSE